MEKVKKVKCACGCGEIVKEGNKFILGHNWKGKKGYWLGKKNPKHSKWMKGKNNPMYRVHRYGKKNPMYGKENKWGHHTKETRIKMSKAQSGKNHPMWGKHHTENSKKKTSKALKGKYIGENASMWGKHHKQKTKKLLSKINRGKNNPFYGNHHNKKTKQKLSKLRKGMHLSKKTKLKIKKNHFDNSNKNHYLWGGHLSKKTKQKISKALKGTKRPPPSKKTRQKMSKAHTNPSKETRLKMSKARKGLYPSKETRQKLSKAQTPERRDQSRQRCIKMLKKGFKPSKFEKRITNIIKQNNLPYKYVGNFQLIIGGKCPDFVNTNGQKIVVEAYEDNFWHDKDYTKTRKKHFAKFGFETKFIHYKNNDEKVIEILKG